MKRQFLSYCAIICGLWGFSLAGVSLANDETKDSEPAKITVTPLAEQLFTQPTAKHLKQGEVIFNVDNRLFFLPDLVESGLDDDDTASNFNAGFSWGITDKLQLSLQFQRVDSSSPARQGNFTSERTEDNEAAGELKYQLWHNSRETQFLSGVISASWGTRGFRFSGEGREVEINNRNVFVSLAVPFTAEVGKKWQFTISPTVAFFNEKNAGFFHRLPIDDPGEFGTVFGITGAVSYEINPRLFIWGDAFIPVSGNNSISRESGKPDTAIAYNAGFRYLINPRLALDFYASNTFGSFAPLSLTADRDLVAFGTNLKFMPDLFAANRKYSDRFNNTEEVITPLTTDGLAFFDGGTTPSGQFIFNLQGGSQGILTALRYGILKDLEVGIYLDYIFDDIDESEQGLSAKVRLLNQAEGSPITLSIATTAGMTNQPFVNFLENDKDEFDRRDLDKEVPIFTPGGDDIEEGKQIIVTLALPLHSQLNSDISLWFTPIVGYVQREGTELAGFNFGGAYAFSSEFTLLAEVGANFAGEGNGFGNQNLEDNVPWTVAMRWTPVSLLGLETSPKNNNPHLELYLTNRVGSSTWHQLRVRDDNEIAIGAGLQLPF
ncbi:MAG: DUF5777 family beta-barrel protein [Xenococcaceae cyanobacterium MO_207.B15]|nr:DUF5777 family beta-barrel protein [Xenococcaceae cyanobacterium MO_207.B15]